MNRRQTQRHGRSPVRGRKSAARPPTMACASFAPNRYLITNLRLIVLLLATACLGAALPALHGQPSDYPRMENGCRGQLVEASIQRDWIVNLDLNS